MARRLAPALFDAARRRGADVGEGKAADAFRLIRDLPYRRPQGRALTAPIDEWCGTCSGKHALLAAVLTEFGLQSRLMVATYAFRWTLPGRPPAELAAVLAAGPVPDVHNFLMISPDGLTWSAVDATWPSSARSLGLVVNAWSPGQHHVLACSEPYEAWEMPAAGDMRAAKEAILARHCGGERRRREAFIAALSAWLATVL